MSFYKSFSSQRWRILIPIIFSTILISLLGTPFSLFTNTNEYLDSSAISLPEIRLPDEKIASALDMQICPPELIFEAGSKIKEGKKILNGLVVFESRLSKEYHRDSFSRLIEKVLGGHELSQGNNKCLPPLLIGGDQADLSVQLGPRILLGEQILSCGENPAVNQYPISDSIDSYQKYLKANRVLKKSSSLLRRLEVRRQKLRLNSNKSGLVALNQQIMKVKLAYKYGKFYIQNGELLSSLFDSLCFSIGEDVNLEMAPNGPSSLAFDSSQRILSWQGNADYFLVYLSSNKTTYSIIGQTSANKFSLSSLPLNKIYQLKVIAVNVITKEQRKIPILSNDSSVISINTAPQITPLPTPNPEVSQIEAPKILSPKQTLIDVDLDDTVTISWSGVTGASSYLTRIKNVTDDTPIELENDYQGTTFRYSPILGKEYRFWVHSRRADFSYENKDSYSDEAFVVFTARAKSATGCIGASSESCAISYGQGSKSRVCSSGAWSEWGNCNLINCNDGYKALGNTCVALVSSPYKKGDKIELLNYTNVRSFGGLTATIIKQLPTGSIGTIIGEFATITDNIIWREVDFGSGIKGFSGEDNFKLYQSSIPCTQGATQQRLRYQTLKVPVGQTCNSETQIGTCTNGIFGNWTGTFVYDYCSPETSTDLNQCASGVARSITKDGITWEFDREYSCGRYVNNDYWIKGNITVTKISRPNGIGRDGSMINPIPSYLSQGYDSRVPGYSVELDVSDNLPLHLTAGQSLVSTISRDPHLPATSSTARPAILAAAVLTVVSADPGVGKFRPPFVGNAKPVYSASNLRRNLLPSLTPVSATPTFQEMEREFPGMPIIDHKLSWEGEFLHPYQSMSHYYGGSMSRSYGDGVLRLFLNDSLPSKETLLIRLVQIGIDHWGEVNAGAFWGSISGTMGVGRKFPIMFAGYMLNEPSMTNIASIVNTIEIFQEDHQTFYLTQQSINAAKQHCGVTDFNNVNPTYYDNLPLGTAVWGERHYDWIQSGGHDICSWRQDPGKVGYDGITYGSTEGVALAARMLGLISAWNHPPFFEWQDRLHSINHWKEWASPFATNMWSRYR